MSVCGNCPYPYEAMLEDPELTEEDACGMGCSHEDAAARAQWAYNQLHARYEELEKKHKDFVNEMMFVADMLGNNTEGIPI